MSMVFDVYVEEYQVHRVMRQFGLYQEFPRTYVVHTVYVGVQK
jgi:hypothetical protein